MLLPDFDRVRSTFSRICTALERWLPTPEVQALGERLRASAQAMQPRIMVYGLYNAGKSTLINALTQRVQAPMGDCPTTCEITPYTWRGYTLLDTPGIDAPVHHEALARAEIDRSDIVLFVIAMGGAIDESRTWEELIEIVQRGRQAMLIINNRQGLSPDSPDYLAVTDRLRGHLQAAAQRAGIFDILRKVPIHLVNARSALKASLENKPALLAHSGMVEFQQDIITFLQKSEKLAALQSCRSDVLRAVDSAEMALQCHAGDTKSQALTQVRQRLEHERTRLASALNQSLDQLLPDARSQIAQHIEHAAHGEAHPGAHTHLEARAHNIAQAIGKQLNHVVVQEVSKTQHQLHDLGDLRTTELACPDAPHLPLASGQPELARKEMLNSFPTDALLKKGIVLAMNFGKKQLPQVAKGKALSNLLRWAGVASKWLGVVVQVISAVWQLNEEAKEQTRQQRQLERQAQNIEDAANAFTRDLRTAYQGLISELVEQVFQPLLQWLAAQDQAAHLQQQTEKDDLLAFGQARIALRLED